MKKIETKVMTFLSERYDLVNGNLYGVLHIKMG